MPAKNLLRVSDEGIYFHIYNIGVDGRVIFNDEEDYKVFLKSLEEYLTAPKDTDSTKISFQIKGKTFRGNPHQPKNYSNDIELIAYSLKPNHFHLVLRQVTKGSVQMFIRSLCTRYSVYFNKKNHRSGPLFSGPYKSVSIETGEHLNLLTHYLHAGTEFSSYPEYIGKRSTHWVKPAAVLDKFEVENNSYEQFVASHQLNSKEIELVHEIVLEREMISHLERRDVTSTEILPFPPPPSAPVVQEKRPRSRIPEFIMLSTALLLLLVTLGVRNVQDTAKTSQSSPNAIVLGETNKITPIPTGIQIPTTPPPAQALNAAIPVMSPEPESDTRITLRVKTKSPSVVIRENPSLTGKKIGHAKNGDIFEFISREAGWYQVRLASGSAGFISATVLVVQEKNNL